MTRPTKYVFITGGVVSSLGKGHRRGLPRPAAQGAWPEGAGAEVRPVHQRRPGHDEPLPARRGLRHRGRRRDGSGHRPLRALRRRESLAELESHLGRHLVLGSAQGAEGRVPRLDRPGHSAHHERDQGPDPARVRGDGHGRGHLRDRRDRRRHRVASVPRGHSPVPARGRERERDLPARDADPVRRRGRRAEDEADAALGQRAAAHRYPPGHRRLPLARGDLAGHPREDRALRRRRAGSGRGVPGRSRRVSRPDRAPGRRARPHGLREARAADRRRRPRRVARSDRADPPAEGGGRDRPRRQVREAPRRVPVGARGAEALGAAPGLLGRACGGWTRRG